MLRKVSREGPRAREGGIVTSSNLTLRIPDTDCIAQLQLKAGCKPRGNWRGTKGGSALKRNRDSPLHSPKECIFNYQIQRGSGPSHRAPPELHLKTENLESLEGFAWEEAPQGKMGRQEERRWVLLYLWCFGQRLDED